MIKRQKLFGIIASVVLAGVGTALLVAYVRSAEDRALEGEKTQRVLVVTDSVPKGTKAEDMAGKVKPELVPTKVMAKGAVASLGTVAGLVTARSSSFPASRSSRPGSPARPASPARPLRRRAHCR